MLLLRVFIHLIFAEITLWNRINILYGYGFCKLNEKLPYINIWMRLYASERFPNIGPENMVIMFSTELANGYGSAPLCATIDIFNALKIRAYGRIRIHRTHNSIRNSAMENVKIQKSIPHIQLQFSFDVLCVWRGKFIANLHNDTFFFNKQTLTKIETKVIRTKINFNPDFFSPKTWNNSARKQ